MVVFSKYVAFGFPSPMRFTATATLWFTFCMHTIFNVSVFHVHNDLMHVFVLGMPQYLSLLYSYSLSLKHSSIYVI